MTFDAYFRTSSYAMIGCAMLALTLAGGLHLGLSAAFVVVMTFAWKAEGSRWQLSERTGLVIVLLSIPLFILDWYYQKSMGEPEGRLGVSALAHLIVFLAAVKLLQVKKNRDWVFLYLISFFSVMLAAGLSLSPVFLGTLTLYLFCALATIIAFEIQKAQHSLPANETRLLVAPDSRIFKNSKRRSKRNVEVSRLPWAAGVLMVLIFVLAMPLFLIAPRTGASMLSRRGGGLTNFIGFSETVNLGEIGSLKRDHAVVMHVRLDEPRPGFDLRWRGVALDEFTGKAWKKSATARVLTEERNDRGLIRISTTSALDRLTSQTVFLEAIESPVLFAASRPVAIQSDFPALSVDAEHSVQRRRLGFGRVMYKALSDMTRPTDETLRSDHGRDPASFRRYTELPSPIDQRIEARANAMVVNAHARNRYDVAKAIETQLQQDYSYSMEMKASGPDPLADFLFEVKAGHCEYFSTAMAVMLRTRGIPARVVNGFLPGEYNAAAGAYTVRQSDAHSWVEVYFPEQRVWVTFDPTPMAGRVEPVSLGFAAQLGKYGEALELFWFQYVVGYDQQEQRTLATSVNVRLVALRYQLSRSLTGFRDAVTTNGPRVILIGAGLVGLALLIFIGTRIGRFGWHSGLKVWRTSAEPQRSAIEFYERMIKLLGDRGIKRDPGQTPLEFATDTGLYEAISLTRVYNRVRFGGQDLTRQDAAEVDSWLRRLEQKAPGGA